ncbi:MAG: PorP/SprF family type IX secretion system membrane protein [Saprospiraceae bacterium]|nr:PorP/SprF family type IX secretion system membrane protein [Saprospiraceae bacterium]
MISCKGRIIWTILVAMGTLLSVQAQDPIYSQFYHAPLQLNPALAGIGHAPRFTALYRNQWPLAGEAFASYATYSVSYDQYFEEYNSGLGLMILADDAGGGLIKSNKLSAFYSYNLRVKDDLYIKGGLEGSVLQTRIGWDQLTFGDQIDPINGPISPGGTPYPTNETRPDDDASVVFDAGTGIVLYSPAYYIGISIKHFNSPNTGIIGENTNAYDGLPLRFGIHGGMEISLGSPNAFIAPNFLFVKQGEFAQLNAGAYVGIHAVYAGLWYRHAQTNPDAVIASFGVKKGVFKIGYSFDYTVSSFGIVNGGSHEFGFIVDLKDVVKKKSVYNDCFQLFR